jgi:hypothetical protein
MKAFTEEEILMSYVPKPKPCFLDGMTKFRVIGNRQVYKSWDKYYSWDELHGEIEVFNKRGKHIMVLDADGNYIKDAVNGRTINVQ